MKTSVILFGTALAVPLAAVACPIGMESNGDYCSPPSGWGYNMDDYIRERHEYIDSIGDGRYDLVPRNTAPRLSPEKLRALESAALEERQAKEKKYEEIAKGLWDLDSKSTPDGKLCIAVFSKYTSADGGKDGGVVGIMGLQQPKTDAWLIFYGTGLPKPKNVKKIRITLQQDDEPAQVVQVFNYKLSREIGTVAFAVPGLAEALDGMRDQQRFKLSLDDKTLMSIQWTGGAAVIEQLKQCAK